MSEQEVRIVGFDCGEDEHQAVLLDGEGQEAFRVAMTNRRDRIEEGFALILLRVPTGAKLVVAVESTRSHGRLVTEVAKGLGCEVWQVNTVALNHFRAVEGQPRKDDVRDAYLCARMVYLRMQGARMKVEISDEERVLSRLTRAYSRIMEARTRALQALHAILLELAPEVLHRHWDGPKVNSKAMLYLLERWPGFRGLERAQLRSIEKILHSCRYGDRAADVAKWLRDVARRIGMSNEERRIVTLEMQNAVEQIRSCDAALGQLKQEISERVQRHPVGVRLLEMPGIGVIVAGVLIGELLPVARTSREAQSATYSGVTPLGRKSGKSLNTSSLTRGVNKWVLHALYTSAVAAKKCSAIDRAYYEKKLLGYAGHKKPHVAAFIALGRQRHKVIFKILTTGARYDKETLISSHLERIKDQQQHEAAA